MNHKWLKTKEAAERLGTTVATIRRWIDDGRLPAVKVGSQWRVREDVLEDFIEKGKID